MAADLPRSIFDSPSLDLEATLRAAGNYVRPSDDHRPKVLEAARQHAGQRQTLKRLAAMTLCATVCLMTGATLSSHLQAKANSAAMPRGEQLNQLLIERDAQSGEGLDWALAEIIGGWRSDVATRLSEGEVGQKPMKRQTD